MKLVVIALPIALMAATPAFACSSCGCNLTSDWLSQGLVTQPGTTIGLRYDYVPQTELRSGTDVVDRNTIALPTTREIEQNTYNHYVTLSVDHAFNAKWAINAQLPFVLRPHRTIAEGDTDQSYSRTEGLGDARISVRYQGFGGAGITGVQLGFKLPTGGFHQEFRTGPAAGSAVDRGLQTGTRTTDLTVGAYHFGKLSGGFDYILQAQGDVPLTSREDFKPGIAGTFPDNTNPLVRGDPTRLRQVIANLLSNAVKFTPEGRIELRISLVHSEDQCRRWRFTVEDTGIGIDREMIGILFAPFVQADASTTRKYGGTGLGLAICRRLVEAMGGDISVESKPAKGSRFWFEVPLPDAPASILPKNQADVEPASMAPLKILLAEDNPINQTLIEGLLRRMHHSVTCVSHGRAAVDAVRSERFDLVLMDMQMPEMDGPEAAAAIRSLELSTAKVPIIALTADASIERRRLYEKAGIDGFLFKPVDSAKLASVIGQIGPTGNPIEILNQDLVESLTDSAADILDKDRLELIARTLGAKQCDQLMAMLCEDIGERPADIVRLFALGDVTAARRSAHSLGGAALHLGATRLAEATRQLEFDGPCADALLLELCDAATETIAAIDRYRAEQEISRGSASPKPA